MTHAKVTVRALALGLLVLGGAACAMDAASAFEASKGSPGDADGGASREAANDLGGAPAFQGAPTATGVVLVHAASFPAFRLCFEGQEGLQPQPNSKIMPDANVVGVEIGSLVRIDPLVASGKVYVINEADVRSPSGDATAPTCGDLLGIPKRGPKTLTRDNHYHEVKTRLTRPLGQAGVQVLAITGCGSQAFLNTLDNAPGGTNAPSAHCGADWNPTSGNLDVKIVDLSPTAEGATATSLPVQLFHMSPAIEAFRTASGSLEVTFGPLSKVKPRAVATGALFTGGEQESLALDQTTPAVYGATGFEIAVTSPAGSSRTEQSLASIQELSSPRDLPTTYYRAASNYALILLGDPAHKPTLDGGGPNPEYNPRRAVHLLAVPVLDPTRAADAGADASDGG
mgnify:CR=1 FL=1